MSTRFQLPRIRSTLQKTSLETPDVTVVQYEDGLRRLFGRQAQLNPNVDDSHIDDKDPRDQEMWSEVDEKRFKFAIREQSRAATASMMNEKFGIPLIFTVTQVVISTQQWWIVVSNEIRQLSWVQVGPTGPPRTNTWMSSSMSGGTHRFRHYFTMPNELLIDKQFGPDNLRHAMESVIQTCLYTMILQTLLGIAERPMLNRAQMRKDHPEIGGGDFLAYIERFVDNFCVCSRSLDTGKHAILDNLQNDGNGKDGLIVAQGKETYMDHFDSDKRSFPERTVVDETDGAVVMKQRFTALKGEVSATWASAIGPVDMVVAPTLHEWSGQPSEMGFQALNRWVSFAYQYDFPRGMPMSLDMMHRERLVVGVHRLDQRGGKFERVYLDDGIRKTRCGYWFRDIDSTNLSEEANRWLNGDPGGADAGINGDYGREARKKWFAAIRTMDDGDSPARSVATELEGTRFGRSKPTGWRDLTHLVHFGLDADPNDPKLAHVRQAGEIPEPFLHTVEFHDLARRIATSGPPEAVQRRLQQIAGLTTDKSRQFVDVLSRADAVGVRAMADTAKFATALSTWFNNNFSGTKDQSPAALPGPAHGPFRPGPRLKSVLTPLYAILPNGAHEALQAHQPIFDRLEKEQPDKAADMVKKLETKIKAYNQDAGFMSAYLQTALKELSAQGFTLEAAANVDAPLPIVPTALVTKMGRLATPQESAEVRISNILDADSPEWSKAAEIRAALASSARPSGTLGAYPTDPRWHGSDEDNLNDSAIEANLPIDFTRFEELRSHVPNMTPLELGIMLLLFRLDVSPRTQARLANMGLLFANFSVTRFCETQRTCDLICMKVGGDPL
jgi:hypothetical protein